MANEQIAWRANFGSQPLEAKGCRIHVKLRNGYRTNKAAPGRMMLSPNGWPADEAIWDDRGHPFDIVAWVHA